MEASKFIQPNYSNTYKWQVLLLLTGTYAFNFIDRQIVLILQEPIKLDLGLSDTQLGFLTGPAFAIVYAILSIPIARIADKGNRKNIVVLSLVVSSILTVIAGMAINFVHILAARLGVGVGQAGASPPAHSIISDYFPPEKRSTALSIYSVGVFIGILLSFAGGGILAQYFGWRMAFIILGIPGILFAIPVYFIVKEPPKGLSDNTQIIKTPSFISVINTLVTRKTFVFAALGSGFHAFSVYGTTSFLPSFLARIHALSIQEIGIYFGLTAGIGGGLGVFLGGYLTDKLRSRDLRWYLWLPTIAGLIYMIPLSIIFFHSNTTVVIATTLFSSILGSIYLGPTLAVSHSLVNAKMRSLASAVLFFSIGIIGLTLSPLIIGMLSDWLEPTYRQFSLRWAFLSTFVSSGLAVVLYFLAAKNYLIDLKRVV